MSTRYRELVAGHEVEHDWPTMQWPIVMLSRPETQNDLVYFTPEEARRLAKALIEAAEVAES
jgi:hypothetical protein